MKVRKRWVMALCLFIVVFCWIFRPKCLTDMAGVADKGKQITRYSISAVGDGAEQCWVTEPKDMQEVWKALEETKVTFVPKFSQGVMYDGDQVMYHLRIYQGEHPVGQIGFLDDGRVFGETGEYHDKGENPAEWTERLERLLEKYTNSVRNIDFLEKV